MLDDAGALHLSLIWVPQWQGVMIIKVIVAAIIVVDQRGVQQSGVTRLGTLRHSGALRTLRRPDEAAAQWPITGRRRS